MGKLRSAARLSPADHFAFAEAMAAMLVARMLVRFVPIRRWSRHLETDAQTGTPAQADLPVLDRVARAIGRAGRNAPVALVCLPQALAARWMLGRRGIATQLYIGQRNSRYSAVDDSHTWHAWLKAGDVWVTGQCNEQHYNVFARPRPES